MFTIKKAIVLLFLALSFFVVSRADAAEILQKSGSSFSNPTVSDNKVRINVTTGNVKYIRHTKYAQSSWNSPVAYKQLRASTNFTGFAYSCPGYYMTRIYSDSAGTKMIGWVRVYVANSDIKNAACSPVLDESKKVPAATQKINVTHPSDVVNEPSKMITQSTSVSSSAPVTRDTTDEDLTEFVAGQVDAATLSAEKACTAKAASTGVSYQLKYNSNTSSWECVVTSDCLYNSGLWHCNAQTVAQKYAGTATTIDNPNRDAYMEESCTDATGANCLEMYTVSNYSRPTNNITNKYESGGGATTEPEKPEGTEPENPDNNKNPETKPEVTPPPTVASCFNADGTPIFSDPLCHFNCDDPAMQAYSECAPDTSHYQDIQYCWDENGDFKYDSPYCDFLNCEQGDKSTLERFDLWEECGGPIACDDLDGSAQRIIAMGGDIGDIDMICHYELSNGENVCITAWGNFMFKNPACNPCDNPEWARENLGMACPDSAQYDKSPGGLITGTPSSGNQGGVAPPDKSCADLICECILALYPALIQIDESVHEIGDQITNAITDFHGEFKTDREYKINPLPDISGVLDANRPPESVDRQDKFTDNNTYFTDQGDDTEGDYGKLAPVPEPKHWDGFLPDEAMPAETELNKDSEIKQSPENKTDATLQQSPEMKVDSMQQSPEMKVDSMQQSPEMKVDSMQQSPEMKMDSMQQSPEMKQEHLNQDEQYKRNHFYNQTNTNLGGN